MKEGLIILGQWRYKKPIERKSSRLKAVTIFTAIRMIIYSLEEDVYSHYEWYKYMFEFFWIWMSLFWVKPDSWKTTALNILTFPSFLLIALVYRTGPQHHTVSFHCGIKQEEEGEKKEMLLKLLKRWQSFARCSLYRNLKIMPLDAPKLHESKY